MVRSRLYSEEKLQIKQKSSSPPHKPQKLFLKKSPLRKSKTLLQGKDTKKVQITHYFTMFPRGYTLAVEVSTDLKQVPPAISALRGSGR